jgi:organic radical activating enzyme
MKRFELIPNKDWVKYDLKITLKPSFRCNQKCWFCNEYDNNTKMWTQDMCDAVLDKLTQIPTDKKRLFIYMYGGEPTLSKYWEHLQLQIVQKFKDRELFIQTQTNMSLGKRRLSRFLKEINNTKQSHHVVDICSSYHLGKQRVEDYLQKMDICSEHNALGLCHFSTEIEKEDQFLTEFSTIAAQYPDKLKIKFTQLENLVKTTNPIYTELLKDDYLRGSDNGESLEFRYFMQKYPELERYLEHSWSFNVDGEVLNYSDIKERGIYRMFKYMKCQAGRKNVVIDHNLKVYRCNDYYYSQIDPIDLSDLNFTEFLLQDVRCLNCKCTDGLDHIKYK